jgi:hypothetical protein
MAGSMEMTDFRTLRHDVLENLTDVSEVLTASITALMMETVRTLKCWPTSTRIHGVIFQKAVIFKYYFKQNQFNNVKCRETLRSNEWIVDHSSLIELRKYGNTARI